MRANTNKVLDLFGQSTTIADEWPYLSSVLSQKCAECRNNQVAMNLLKMNNLQVCVLNVSRTLSGQPLFFIVVFHRLCEGAGELD
jgi:hypothetical protein